MAEKTTNEVVLEALNGGLDIGLKGDELAGVKAIVEDIVKRELDARRTAEPLNVKAALQAKLPEKLRSRAGDMVEADGGWSPDVDLIRETAQDEEGGSRKAFEVANVTRANEKDEDSELLRAFHKACDEVMLLREMNKAQKGAAETDFTKKSNQRVVERFYRLRAAVGATYGLDMKAYAEDSDSDWWPTTWSQNMIQAIRLEPVLMSLFRVFTLPGTAKFDYPVQPQAPMAFLAPYEGMDTGAMMGASNAGAKSVTFEPFGIAVQSVISQKFQFGSNVDIAAETTTQIARGLGESVDMLILNGQKGGLLDTGSVVFSDDPRYGCDGLRKFAFDNSLNFDAGTFGLGSLAAIQLMMRDRYAAKFDRLVWITSVGARAFMMTDSAFTSLQTAYAITASLATLITGQLGMLLGSPLAVTPAASRNMNATGYDGRVYGNPMTQDFSSVIDPSTYDKSSLMCAHRDAWGFAQFGGPTVAMEYFPHRFQYVVTGYHYVDFQSLFGTEASLGNGINVPNPS